MVVGEGDRVADVGSTEYLGPKRRLMGEKGRDWEKG